MQVKWEESDIVCGRRVFKPGVTEQQLIGYSYPEDGEKQFAMISLCDGMVIPKSKPDLVESLNLGGYLPVELMKTGGASA